MDHTIPNEAFVGADKVFKETRKARAAIAAAFGGWSGYSWWLIAVRAATLTNPQIAAVVSIATISGAIAGYGWSTLGLESATHAIAKNYIKVLASKEEAK
jgi:hypothetical protein